MGDDDRDNQAMESTREGCKKNEEFVGIKHCISEKTQKQRNIMTEEVYIFMGIIFRPADCVT